jgi:hypothetical protein
MKAGDHVAGYRIERVLGRGGMGTVYEATQLSLNRTVALKILAPQLTEDLHFRERFRREGHIQAAIDHPHIVTVYEAGEADAGLFLAMRLVRGSTLKDMIVGRDLEGARTLRLLRPIADALDTAHEVGLTHRDIKPQNILVGVRDHAFLADFGLTKDNSQTGLTRTGQFVGTIDYIAPEQIRGEEAGAPSDIYALTAVLYECLSGVVPYPKPSDAAVLYAHISDAPPLVTDQRPELPSALDEVIARGMAKDPADRQPTATELIAEAERAFGKRVRAVITPPGPVEGPEEIGLREEESRISTRESRLGGVLADTQMLDDAARRSRSPAGVDPPPGDGVAEEAPRERAADDAPLAAAGPRRDTVVGSSSPPSGAALAPPDDSATAAELPQPSPDEVATGDASAPTLAGDAATAPTKRGEAGVDAVAEPAGPPQDAEADGRDHDPVPDAPDAPRSPTSPGAGGSTRVAALFDAADSEPPRDAPVDLGAPTRVPRATPTTGSPAGSDTTGQAAPPAAGSPARSHTPGGAPPPAAARAAGSPARSDTAGGAPPPDTAAARDRDPGIPVDPPATPSGRATRTGRLAAAALLGLLVLAAAGFVVGRGGSPSRSTAQSQPALTNSASNADVVLTTPASWRRAERSPEIDGLRLTDSMTLVAGAGDAGLVVGRVGEAGSALLPAAFERRADPRPTLDDPIRTAHLEGYRQRSLRVVGYTGMVDVLAAPTSGATVVFACFFTVATVADRDDCWRIVDSARLVRGEAGHIAVDTAYAGRLNRVLDRVNGQTASRRRALRKARTPRGQGRIAASLARVQRRAARDVRRAEPPSLARAANRAIASAFDDASQAYGRLGSAARAADRARYARARRAVRRAEHAGRTALARLERFGYTRLSHG